MIKRQNIEGNYLQVFLGKQIAYKFLSNTRDLLIGGGGEFTK